MMNETTEDFEAFMKEHISRVAMVTTMFMVAHMLYLMDEQTQKKLAEVLSREPTLEDYWYYQELQWQKAKYQEARQREIDHEKIRRLVMGDNDAANSTK